MLLFRQLELTDIPALLALQEAVKQSLPDPELFQCEDEPYFARLLAGTGAGFGAFYQKTLAGFAILAFPGVHPENLCYDIPHFQIDPTEVAHLDGSAVHPSYRGLAIQHRLTILRIAYAAPKGARHFLMTISPRNVYSLRNHLNGGGFRVYAIKRKYGGVWRFILHRALDSEEPTSVGRRELCALDDIEGHRRLLDAGFYGIRVLGKDGDWRLAYERWPE